MYDIRKFEISLEENGYRTFYDFLNDFREKNPDMNIIGYKSKLNMDNGKYEIELQCKKKRVIQSDN